MELGRQRTSWHLSFGDLITLLMTFFITTISLSPLNPATRNRVQSADTTGTSIALKAKEGSRLAQAGIVNDYKELIIQLQDSDFIDQAELVKPEVMLEIKNSIKADGYIVEQLILAACFKSEWLQQELVWEASKQRTLALASQLIDSGLSNDVLELRVLGPNCAALKSPRAEVSAQLAVKFRKR